MSHLPQRKEKNCLNCGTEVIGNFCHNCGQENIEPKESIWHLISHFFQDITHFDGKFFSSLKILILKPGFLSKEYIIGRRASYLNPIRMYLFTSAVFFIIFFSIYNFDKDNLKGKVTVYGKTSEQINKMDSAQFVEFTKKFNGGKSLTRTELKKRFDSSGFTLTPGNYRSREHYDSLLRTGVKKHSWFERMLVHKSFAIKDKYGSDSKVVLAALLNRFLHTLPQMLFALLPLFALILKLVYIRRKQFYYVDHVIFTIHLYIFIFLAMLISFGITKIKNLLNWDWLSIISQVIILLIFFYFYKALRNFYKQRRAKTILKYFILLLLFFFTTLLMFVVFFGFSLFQL